MSLIIDCPEGHRLKVPNKHAGLKIRCPVCDQSVLVPGPRPVAAPPKATGATTPLVSPSPLDSVPLEELPKTVSRSNGDEQVFDSAAVRSIARSESANAPGISLPTTMRLDVQPKLAPEQVDATAPSFFDALKATPDEPETVGDDSFPSVEHQAVRDQHSLEQPQRPEELFDAIALERSGAPPQSDIPGLDLGIDFESVKAEETKHWFNVHGNTFERRQVWTCLSLGVAAIMIACFCATPSVVDHVAHWQGNSVYAADGWTYIVLLGALIQAAVGLYAIRLPHWSTSWVASLTTTGIAGAYACGLALTMFAARDHEIVRWLGLLDEAFHKTAQAWCFLIVCITLILAYAYGRFSLRWYQLERQLQESRQ